MSGNTRTVSSAGKKKGGGFLARQAKAKKPGSLTEEEILQKEIITPDDVLRLNKITESKWQILHIFHEE